MAKGFAGMSPERRKEVSRKGGRAAHRSGKAHRFTPEEASIAGKKGVEARKHKRLRKLESESWKEYMERTANETLFT